MGESDSDDDFLADVDDAEIDDWVSDEELDAELDAELAKDSEAVAAELDEVALDEPAISAPKKEVVLTRPEQQEFKAEAEEGGLHDKDVGEQEPTPFSGLGLGSLFGGSRVQPGERTEQKSTWGFSRTLWSVTKAVGSAAQATMEVASRDLSELQSRVTDMVAPEPEEGIKEVDGDLSDGGNEAASGVTAIEDLEKRRLLMAKFQEAQDDDELDLSLKKLDDQMENLATNAIGLLGNVWGGAKKLASSAAAEIKQGVEDVKELHVLQVVAGGAREVANKGSNALEGIGKTAIGILTQPTGWDQETSAIDELSPEEVSFERCFYIYGGPEFLEELELVGTECTIRCNRVRALMNDVDKTAFDSNLQTLQDILSALGPQSTTTADSEVDLTGASVKAVNALVMESMRRAEGLTLSVAGALKAEFLDMQDGEADVEESLAQARTQLEMVRAEGVKQLSEMCTVCVAHLLQYTAHLIESQGSDTADNTAEITEGDLHWPEDALAKARVIRCHTQHMLSALDNVLEVFISALATAAASAASSVEEGAPKEVKDAVEALQADCEEMRNDIKSDGESACNRVQRAEPVQDSEAEQRVEPNATDANNSVSEEASVSVSVALETEKEETIPATDSTPPVVEEMKTEPSLTKGGEVAPTLEVVAPIAPPEELDGPEPEASVLPHEKATSVSVVPPEEAHATTDKRTTTPEEQGARREAEATNEENDSGKKGKKKRNKKGKGGGGRP